jgi:hypothetical protein
VLAGSNFPVDTTSLPSSVGFGGFGYDGHGSELVARATFRVSSPDVNCCVVPIVEVDYETGTFSQLGAGQQATPFDEGGRICFESGEGRSTKSWGGVKALYK